MLDFLAVFMGAFNCLLLGVVIFILKQPDPQKGRELQEFQELKDRLHDMAKAIAGLEKKIEKHIAESVNENRAQIDKINKDVSRQLKEISDNL